MKRQKNIEQINKPKLSKNKSFDISPTKIYAQTPYNNPIKIARNLIDYQYYDKNLRDTHESRNNYNAKISQENMRNEEQGQSNYSFFEVNHNDSKSIRRKYMLEYQKELLEQIEAKKSIILV